MPTACESAPLSNVAGPCINGTGREVSFQQNSCYYRIASACSCQVAEKLKAVGYRPHMVGKFDAGMATFRHTPAGRGFESWLGCFRPACACTAAMSLFSGLVMRHCLCRVFSGTSDTAMCAPLLCVCLYSCLIHRILAPSDRVNTAAKLMGSAAKPLPGLLDRNRQVRHGKLHWPGRRRGRNGRPVAPGQFWGGLRPVRGPCSCPYSCPYS